MIPHLDKEKLDVQFQIHSSYQGQTANDVRECPIKVHVDILHWKCGHLFKTKQKT